MERSPWFPDDPEAMRRQIEGMRLALEHSQILAILAPPNDGPPVALATDDGESDDARRALLTQILGPGFALLEVLPWNAAT